MERVAGTDVRTRSVGEIQCGRTSDHAHFRNFYAGLSLRRTSMAREYDEEFVQEIYKIEPKYFRHPMSRLCIGNGWLPIMWALVYQIKYVLTDEDFMFLRVKEKFGLLNIQEAYDKRTAKKRKSTVWNMCRMAEAMSTKVCERCGRAGTMHTHKGWMRTLCKECQEEREKE